MQQSKVFKGSVTNTKKPVLLEVGGQASAGIQVVGTFSGTLQFEGSIDGLTWYSVPFKAPATGLEKTSTTTTGLFIGSVAEIMFLRVRASTFASGTAEINILTSVGTHSKSSMNLLTPNKIALSQVVTSSISASTTLAITSGATFLRVYASDKDVYFKWGSTAVTNANFDEVIPANQVIDLYIPVETGTTLYTTARVIEKSATATLTVIQK